MSRVNIFVLFYGDTEPTIETYFDDKFGTAKQRAEAYIAQRIFGQAMHKTKFIERIWMEAA